MHLNAAASAPRAGAFALKKFLAAGLGRFVYHEIKNEGITNCLKTIGGSIRHKDLFFSPERTLGQELEVRAKRLGSRPFLTFEGQQISYAELDRAAARVAGFMTEKGLVEGACVGLLMPNVPAYLEVFFATQRIGACAVPMNTALKGDGLAHIFNDAGISMLFTVASLLPELEKISDRIEHPLRIVLVPEFRHEQHQSLTSAWTITPYQEALDSSPQPSARTDIAPETTSMLMYTSGTTGYPKGVVYAYGKSQAKMLRILAHLLVKEDDIYYTCLPLFHANALMVTVVSSLYAGAQVALYRKFSARQFWQEVRESRATLVNTLGTMIAILMKQPNDPLDGQHCLRQVLSAACPAELWEDFERRFKVRLTESFGAVDGGGITTMNVGNAPVGSIGKPLGKTKWRLVDAEGQDVPLGTAGELVHYVGGSGRGQVKYHRNQQASAEKTRSGWVYSGDLLRADAQGFLYFVGRNTDSMRCGGENISALEVESAVNQYEPVLESAAYAIPSELAEDDIMIAVQAKESATVEPEQLYQFVQDKLARFAWPKYIRVVKDLPKTETHRIIKHLLKQEGVTADTWIAPKSGR
jgi:crotonobetaine/carnitine-CoA ligase